MTDSLELTNQGRYLSAFGSLDAYRSAIDFQLPEKAQINWATFLLDRLPMFGEFTVRPQERRHFNGVSGETTFKSWEEYNTYKGDTLEVNYKNEYIRIYKDECVLQYLVSKGFVINRRDLHKDSEEGLLYRELTPNGRDLKSRGSIEAYDKWRQDLRDEELNAKELQTQSLKSNITAATFQRQMVFANIWIAIGGIVAASYYAACFAVLIHDHPPLYYSVAVTSYILILGALIGIGGTSLTWLILRAYKAKKMT